MEKLFEKDAACMLIINPETGKVLGVSRKNDHQDMGIIGGKVEDNETIEDAAVRECLEETGVTVVRMVKVFYAPARTRMVTTFLALEWHGEPRSSEEGIVRWVDLDELFTGTYGEYNKQLFCSVMKMCYKNALSADND
jgi:8-oxo-dGTP pyrophosphatase MutT (NUDIX family)